MPDVTKQLLILNPSMKYYSANTKVRMRLKARYFGFKKISGNQHHSKKFIKMLQCFDVKTFTLHGIERDLISGYDDRSIHDFTNAKQSIGIMGKVVINRRISILNGAPKMPSGGNGVVGNEVGDRNQCIGQFNRIGTRGFVPISFSVSQSVAKTFWLIKQNKVDFGSNSSWMLTVNGSFQEFERHHWNKKVNRLWLSVALNVRQ